MKKYSKPFRKRNQFKRKAKSGGTFHYRPQLKSSVKIDSMLDGLMAMFLPGVFGKKG